MSCDAIGVPAPYGCGGCRLEFEEEPDFVRHMVAMHPWWTAGELMRLDKELKRLGQKPTVITSTTASQGTLLDYSVELPR